MCIFIFQGFGIRLIVIDKDPILDNTIDDITSIIWPADIPPSGTVTKTEVHKRSRADPTR